MAGISLSEYIRRRRMTQAAYEIQTTDIKILDVALKYGYISPTSFNRAFQSVHGISPTSAKAQGSIMRHGRKQKECPAFLGRNFEK